MCGFQDTAAIGSRRERGQQQIQQSLLGVEFGFVGNVFQLLLANHFNREFDEIADHGFDIAADIADFRELRSFHFEEWRIRELGQSAGDFSFANAGGSDHDDVLGNDFFGQFRRELLPAHAVAQSNGNGALGGLLPDNILVELSHDFARRKFVEHDLLVFGGGGEV